RVRGQVGGRADLPARRLISGVDARGRRVGRATEGLAGGAGELPVPDLRVVGIPGGDIVDALEADRPGRGRAAARTRARELGPAQVQRVGEVSPGAVASDVHARGIEAVGAGLSLQQRVGAGEVVELLDVGVDARAPTDAAERLTEPIIDARAGDRAARALDQRFAQVGERELVPGLPQAAVGE